MFYFLSHARFARAHRELREKQPFSPIPPQAGLEKKFTLCKLCTANDQFLEILLRISCCKFRNPCNWNMLHMNYGASDYPPSLCQNVARSTWHPTDNPVGTQHTQTMSYPSRDAPFCFNFVRGSREQIADKISISEPVIEASAFKYRSLLAWEISARR